MAKKQGSIWTGPLGEAVATCRTHFTAAAVFSALANLLYLAPTLYMIQVYDRAVPTGGLTTLAGLTLVVALSLIALSALEWIRTRILVRAGVRMDRQLAPALLSAILSLPSLTPAARAQTMREFDMFRQVMAGQGLLAALDLPWIPIYLIAACLLSPWLALAGAVSAVIMLGLAWLNERATKESLQQANDAASESASSMDYTTSSAGVVSALGMRNALVAVHLHKRRGMTALQAKASFAAGGYLSLTKGFRLLVQSLALGLGALLVIEGKMSPGAIFAASFLLARILAPVEQGVGAWKGIVLARQAATKLSAVLTLQAARARDHTLLPTPKGDVRAEGLFVTGGAGRPPLLSDINFHVAPGDMVGVLGPSGAGKSTLARALVGASAADLGVVRVDGAALTDWDSEHLGRHIGYVPQDFVLFPGTVKDNISRFRAELGESAAEIDRMVVEAARRIGAHEMILRLPKGYDTPIGGAGVGLSSGQAQRIAIARALFGEPRFVVMDEPNAHLDAEGEAALIEALSDLRAMGCAIVVIAHRSNVLAGANNLLVLRAGRIGLFGPTEDVVKRLQQAAPPQPAPAPPAAHTVSATAPQRMQA